MTAQVTQDTVRESRVCVNGLVLCCRQGTNSLYCSSTYERSRHLWLRPRGTELKTKARASVTALSLGKSSEADRLSLQVPWKLIKDLV